MAEATLVGIAKAVLTQLASPALKEFKLLWGHKKELRKLEDTINTVKNVLEDADRKQADSEAVQGWLARLRVVLYDADDLFDRVSYLVLHEKAITDGKITKKVSHLTSKPYQLFKHYQEVKAIRESLDGIAGDINKFGLITSLARNDQEHSKRVQREQTHSYFPSSEVVGRDQEREDIMKLLLADNCEGKRGVSIVAVIGIGGMGKTTLAQFVYGDERVKQGFDLCMWCCVNYFSDLKGTLEVTIRSATGSAAPERLDVEQLQIKLRDVICGKRFLLILDDVWDEDAENWHKLQILLNSGKGGSMVLATTRSVEVAQSMCAAKPYYYLKGLTDESAWLLFKKIAFGEGSEGQNCGDLEQSGREIVNKCGNAPLAIRVIASMLRHKKKNEWFRYADELSKVAPVEHGKVMQVLKMSYSTLPSPIKRCFAFCSLFSKGHRFLKDNLVHLWIAQGFVEDSTAGQSLEDVAEGYFLCLVNRCFIQNNDPGSFPKMHDLVHDLALEMAKSESISVYEIGLNFGDNTLRHVSIHCDLADSSIEQLSSFSQLKRLRTFLLKNKVYQYKIKNVDKLIPCFKTVRVLDLSSMGIEKIPDSVGQLIQLRYLDLSVNGLKMFPSSICSLHHLQYLDLSDNGFEILPSSICSLLHLRYLNLRYCSSLKELPKEIGKLMSLRHLLITGCVKLSQMPAELGNLTSLVTLDCQVVHSASGGLRYLEGLDNLSGSLLIELPGSAWENATIDAEKACLSKKHRLYSLHIHWQSEVLETADTVMNALRPHSNLNYLYIFRFGGEKMPHWISEIHNLVYLTIHSCGRCAELPSLRHLKFLKGLMILEMFSLVEMEEEGIGSMSDHPDSVFFPSLETLYICSMPNLMRCWKQVPPTQLVFHSVIEVTIRGCPKLTTCMPLFPQVEDLELHDIPEKLFWQAIGSEGTNRLKKLKLGSINGLGSLPRAIGVEYLTSLQELAIFNSKEVYLSWGTILGLPHLRVLKFYKLEKVIDVGSDDVQRQPSSPLQELVIERTSGEWLEGIPWRSFPSLHGLELWNITNLEALPQGIQHLTSLQGLLLDRCESVVSMPHWMTSLSSLRFLGIYGCSEELKERCKRLTGEDWPNIQHISRIRIDSEVI